MDIWGAILVLIRRFYITVPLAAATLFGAYAMTHSIPPEYHASSSLVLIGPTVQVDKQNPLPPNPYIAMGTKTLMSTLLIDVYSPQTLAQLRAAHNTTNFAATNLNQTSILNFTTTSTDPRQAISSANQLLGIVQADVTGRQKRYVTETAQGMSAQVLAQAQLATIDTKSRTKALAIAIGAALLLTIIFVLVVDAMLTNRGRRQRDRRGANVDNHAAAQDRTPVVRP